MELIDFDHCLVRFRCPWCRLLWWRNSQWNAAGTDCVAILVRHWHWVYQKHLIIADLQQLIYNRGEYPAGSVACAESTGELKEGHRNRWFIASTNLQIDLGFVVSAFVPMIVVLACTESHLRAAWRICLGLGCIPPLSLLYLRLKLQEPEEFNRETMKNVRTPWMLVIK